LNQNTYTNNTFWTNQLDELVLYASLGLSLSVCLEVAQITDVSLSVLWGTMVFTMRVD